MTNKEIARKFNLLGKVMELHGENPFKIRSYSSAYNTIRRYPDELVEMTREDLMSIKGIGKNIADKIEELRETGSMITLKRFLEQTPKGVVELLGIKGLGAKKILAVWKDLGIESPGELLYACEENRLIDLKGFGEKTQINLRDKLIYYLDAQGKYLYGHIESEAIELLGLIRSQFADHRFEFINDVRRQMPIVESIEILGSADESEIKDFVDGLDGSENEENVRSYKGTRILYHAVELDDFDPVLFEGSASPEFLVGWKTKFGKVGSGAEQYLFESNGLAYLPPESRESEMAIQSALRQDFELINDSHIKGVIHCHTTYSDGANSVRQMWEHAEKLGFEYILITDHSQSAFYANGLKEDRVDQQHAEIDQINQELGTKRIFKGIESDILYDGSLDYPEDVLSRFDVIIASVHSNLKMDEVKATDRVLQAVSNPFTRILGHPTGRLLLSREGYPLDHMAVIDACADHGVSIELNANPYRLDLDWTWIPYAVEKGVMISINPDAHNINGISDIKYGVSAARKALLQPSSCLNTLSLEDFSRWVSQKRACQ